jgi:hypothetical protein
MEEVRQEWNVVFFAYVEELRRAAVDDNFLLYVWDCVLLLVRQEWNVVFFADVEELRRAAVDDNFLLYVWV